MEDMGSWKQKKTEMKPKQEWFCLLAVLFSLSALSAVVIYSSFYWPVEFRFLFLFFNPLSCLLFKCCVKKYAPDTETKTETRSINGEITGIRTRTGNGTTGNRTIRNCDEFKFYDSRWRAEFERPNLSSSTHTGTNNCEFLLSQELLWMIFHYKDRYLYIDPVGILSQGWLIVIDFLFLFLFPSMNPQIPWGLIPPQQHPLLRGLCLYRHMIK